MANSDLIRQYRRLWLAEEDLVEVREFARFIVERDLHSRHKNQLDWELRALSLAVVVSYARAFVKTESSDQRPAATRLPTAVLDCLTDAERELHHRLLARRHQELAHSDLRPTELEVEIIDGEALSSSTVTRVPLARAETELLLRMVTKLVAELARREQELRAMLPTNVTF